jgi:hypothetical protein
LLCEQFRPIDSTGLTRCIEEKTFHPIFGHGIADNLSSNRRESCDILTNAIFNALWAWKKKPTFHAILNVLTNSVDKFLLMTNNSKPIGAPVALFGALSPFTANLAAHGGFVVICKGLLTGNPVVISSVSGHGHFLLDRQSGPSQLG